MTLEPGDIITTGTPPGVGLGQKPAPWYLKAGDVVELGIDKLGQQRQDFVAWQGLAGASRAARPSSLAARRAWARRWTGRAPVRERGGRYGMSLVGSLVM